MKQEELSEHLTDLHIRIKETLRMQIALEKILHNNVPECHGPHILADVVKNRLGAMDLYLDLCLMNARQNTKPTKESMKAGSTVFPATSNEVIDADARRHP